MVPPCGNQQCGRNTSSSCSPSGAFPETSTSSSCGVGEVLVEICTPGARSPIHFVEGFAASCRGRSRSGSSTRTTSSSRGFLTPTLFSPRLASAPAAPTSSKTNGRVSSTSAKHHRRTSTPLDGVCLTLLGVSTGLKTPGVDTWAVARALMESGVDLRTRNARGMTPLHLACSAGQVNIRRMIWIPPGACFQVHFNSSHRDIGIKIMCISSYASSRASMTAAFSTAGASARSTVCMPLARFTAAMYPYISGTHYLL